MPFYRERLLSAWGNERYFETGKPPIGIDPEIFKTLRPNPGGIGQIAPNPRKSLRNQAGEGRSANSSSTVLTTPKLLSEKSRSRDPKSNSSGSPIRDTTEALLNAALSDNTKVEVPNYYANLIIQFGKLGIEDFDFRYVFSLYHIISTEYMVGTSTRHATLA